MQNETGSSYPIHPIFQKAVRPFTRWYGSRPNQFEKYHNKLGPRVNSTYLRYAEYCRNQHACPRDDDGVRSQGSILVPEVLQTSVADELSRKMGSLIENDENSVSANTSQLMRSVHRPASKLGTSVLDIFHNPILDGGIREFFGSNYRIQWMDCYRSLPTKDVSHAWLWHSDNVPCETLKVMLHLTDAGEHRGATQFMSLGDTEAYYRAGYRGSRSSRRENLDQFAQQHSLPHRPFHHDAKAGDVMLFLNNALHKAVPPQTSFRDVLTYLLLPNPIPWDKQLACDGLESIEFNPGGYPQSPFPEQAINVNRAA
ncbi:phytanoyl-CoA dioxygenase family protein [Neorhodopirellula lusitana]|uniref:phytanoyl-CoA dioxygenase family protein n=1 Tax=Neorhodopirellula lusitana TaxID=445327 RepID=UPI00384FA95E